MQVSGDSLTFGGAGVPLAPKALRHVSQAQSIEDPRQEAGSKHAEHRAQTRLPEGRRQRNSESRWSRPRTQAFGRFGLEPKISWRQPRVEGLPPGSGFRPSPVEADETVAETRSFRLR